MNSRVLLVVLALTIPALLHGSDGTPVDAIEREVLATNDRMLAAANSRDVDAFFAFMTDDSTIIQNGELFPDRQAAMAAVEAGYRGVQQIERVFENPRVTVLSPESALLVSKGRFTVTLDDGRMINGRFVVSLVFVRTNDGWKAKLGHYSAPVAPN